MNHIPSHMQFGRLLGLGVLTVTLVILATDRGVATSGSTSNGQQSGQQNGPQIAPLAHQGKEAKTRQDGQARQEGQRQPRVHWWNDPAVIKELVLRPTQVSKIEKIWTDRVKKMGPAAAEYRKQQTELKRMVAERKVGPETIGLQVDRVESQRTALNKSWTVMLYEFSLVMSPKQNKALEAYRARNRRQGR